VKIPICHPERSEGSQEILRAKALRMTLWDIHSNDKNVILSNDNVFLPCKLETLRALQE